MTKWTRTARTVAMLALCLCSPLAASNETLAQLAQEDQAVRRGEPDPRSDDARRAVVLDILAKGEALSAQDKFNAALVLQHTGLVSCDGELRSLSAENYLLAHHLFKRAFDEGIEGAGYLAAASIDRYLSFTAGTQRYVTNRLIDPDTGEELLVPIDGSVTDEERARYGVPPLHELLKRYREKATDRERSDGAVSAPNGPPRTSRGA